MNMDWTSFLIGVAMGILMVVAAIVVTAIIAHKKYPDPIMDEDEW